MSLEGETKPVELWVNAKSKDGVVYKSIWNCTDISRWKQEEPEVAKQLTVGLTSWLAQDKANEEKLKDWYQGFSMPIGEWEYKVVQNKDGSRKISRKKAGGAKSGGGRPFTLLRTTEVKYGGLEEVSSVINNQLPEDNWEIQYLTTNAEGDKFLILNKKPYTPPSATASSGSATSESNEKQNEAAEAEQTL